MIKSIVKQELKKKKKNAAIINNQGIRIKDNE